MEMQLPKPRRVKVSKIKPYEGNPRKITEKAVTGLAKSIEDYGYVQPIVIDADNVIVAGHTRFQAAQKMGWKEVEVYRLDDLPKREADIFRLVDNRTAELTDWDHDKKVAEMREFEEGVLAQFFPKADLDVGTARADSVDEDDIAEGAARAEHVAERPKVPETDVECPSCHGVFQVRTLTLPGVRFEDLNWD